MNGERIDAAFPPAGLRPEALFARLRRLLLGLLFNLPGHAPTPSMLLI